MSRFSDSADNDSFDDILATVDLPTVKTSSTQAKVASPAKKPRLSFDTDDEIADSLLANVVMPEATTSTQPAEKPTNVPISAGKTNCILVNPKQRGNNISIKLTRVLQIKIHFHFSGNPILKSITNVPWEFDDSIIPDYVVGKTAGILFLSLRYHSLNPDYIHNRLKELGKRFELRVLLVQVDNKVSSSVISFERFPIEKSHFFCS